MILITLAGNSSRFFNEGYNEVKYKLLLNGKSIIQAILEYVPRHEKILVVLNKKFDDKLYITSLLTELSFNEFKVVEISETRGQFESVIFALKASQEFWNENDPIAIYNGDTIRKIDKWTFNNLDGYIEVFESEGEHWSFVDVIGKIGLVTEKSRISAYCSSGFYFFSHVKLVLQHHEEYLINNLNEYFIAPYYNLLLKKGYNIESGLVDKDKFIFCGTPGEYIDSQNTNPPESI
jgi:dTDP-glucose pyrophosphorylase